VGLRTVLALAASGACRIELGAPEVTVTPTGGEPAGEVWVYTSLYPPVIERLEALIAAELPGVEARFYQAGSEKVAQRVEAEWSAGSSPACLLMTSDPFWYAKLAAEGRLRPHLAPDVLKVDRALVDPDGRWATARLSLVVLAVNGEAVPSPPRRFAELAEPAWRDRVTFADPLASGSAYTLLAFLVRDQGWPLVERLEANGLVAAGGNSAVLARVETAERPVGAVLLENLLSAKATRAVPVFPEDGAVLVPGPIAITATCANPTAAGALYDLVLSPAGQAVMVAGDMYAALPSLPPPDGAPALDAIAVRPWTPGFADQVAREASATKDRWAALVSR
jgi:iron(III) transport system substrate-binding protein